MVPSSDSPFLANESNSDEGTFSAVVPSSELLGSPQNSVSVSTIRELIKNIYDR